MFITAIQLSFVYEPYEGLSWNFSVVSVVAFTLLTPGRGAVAITKDHKKISCLNSLMELITQRLRTIISKTTDYYKD